MSKKTVTIYLLIGLLILGVASPSFAQQTGTSGTQGGFFIIVSQFFSKLFHPGVQSTNSQTDDQTAPSETPSGEPNPTLGTGRLQGLVTAGKITQTQEQEILTEVNKIQSEIQTWSQSTGINEGYVYGELRGPGLDAGIGPTGKMPAISAEPVHQGRLPGGTGSMAPLTGSHQ